MELGGERRGPVDLPVLPAQISLLAGCRSRGIAGRVFASDHLVEMCEGISAVAVGWDRCDVDVIDYIRVSKDETCIKGVYMGEIDILKGPPSVGKFEKETE